MTRLLDRAVAPADRAGRRPESDVTADRSAVERTQGENRTPVRPPSDVGPTMDGSFIVGIYAGALGTLAALAVLAIAGANEAGRVLPFAAIPLGLFVVCGFFLWRWATAAGDPLDSPAVADEEEAVRRPSPRRGEAFRSSDASANTGP